MGTLSSNTINMRSGDMSLSMTDTVFPTTNFEVKEVSSIKGTWDVEDNNDSADAVYFDLGSFTFTVFDVLDDGSNLFEDILNLSSSDLITVSVSFTFNSGNTFSDEFKYTKKDVSYDPESRQVTFSTKTNWQNATPIDSFIAGASITFTIEQTGGGGTTFDCVHMSDLIEEGFFDEVNASGTNSLTSPNFQQHQSNDTYVAVDNTNASGADVDDTIYKMAAIEGGILGSVLGYNFYEYRLSTANAVSISEDDVTRYDIDPGYEAYNSISVDIDLTSVGSSPQGAWREVSSDTYNALSQKTLSVLFSPSVINRGDWQGSGLYHADGTGTISSVVVADGLSAYAAAYGADGSARISLEILGLETVKPYEPITLDATFPSFLANTTWRPSEIEYNFMEDKIICSAYKIA